MLPLAPPPEWWPGCDASSATADGQNSVTANHMDRLRAARRRGEGQEGGSMNH